MASPADTIQLTSAATPEGQLPELPLFPLQTVLFPGGRLALKVFEARYLDLISRCLRDATPFAVVCLLQGSEVHVSGDQPSRFEQVGVLAHVDEVDAEQAGILLVRCRGGQRVSLARPRQGRDGLWLADGTRWPREPTCPIPPELQAARDALRRAIGAIQAQGEASPFAQPYRYDDAGWVSNRWCELLPVSLAAKQRLMALDDALTRLQLVDDFLRGKGVY